MHQLYSFGRKYVLATDSGACCTQSGALRHYQSKRVLSYKESPTNHLLITYS